MKDLNTAKKDLEYWKIELRNASRRRNVCLEEIKAHEEMIEKLERETKGINKYLEDKVKQQRMKESGFGKENVSQN